MNRAVKHCSAAATTSNFTEISAKHWPPGWRVTQSAESRSEIEASDRELLVRRRLDCWGPAKPELLKAQAPFLNGLLSSNQALQPITKLLEAEQISLQIG